MPKQQSFFLLVANPEPIPLAELYELTGEENVSITDLGLTVHYEITWDDVQVALTTMGEGEQRDTVETAGNRMRVWLEDRQDKHAKKVRRRVPRMDGAYRVTVTSDWDDERKAQYLVQGVMAYYDYAYIYTGDGLYNENGNRDIGSAKSVPTLWPKPTVDDDVSAEARRRKQVTIDQLKRRNIATIDHLPAIVDSETASLCDLRTTIERAIVLCLVANYSVTLDDITLLKWLAAFGLEDGLTPLEEEFVEEADPIVEKRHTYGPQRYEAAMTLFWAAGLVDELPDPSQWTPLDSFALADALHRLPEDDTTTPDDNTLPTIDELMQQTTMRAISAILDTTDLVYRLHWAVVDAELYGRRAPSHMDADVLYQRHYALNWLVSDSDWDDTSPDT